MQTTVRNKTRLHVPLKCHQLFRHFDIRDGVVNLQKACRTEDCHDLLLQRLKVTAMPLSCFSSTRQSHPSWTHQISRDVHVISSHHADLSRLAHLDASARMSSHMLL